MPLCPAATCTVRPLRHLRSVSPTQTQSCRPRIKAGGSTVLLATPERQNGPSTSSEPARREGEGRTDQTEASRLQKRVALILEDQAPFPGFGQQQRRDACHPDDQRDIDIEKMLDPLTLEPQRDHLEIGRAHV